MSDRETTNSSECLPRIIVIVGATAVGKTAVAIDIAQKFHGEVVNVDSRLFYRGMDIGTAKPTVAERRGIPHHMIDFLAPNDPVSLATVQDMAFSIIDDILARESLPILVGGTPQYVNAIVENWNIPRVPPDPQLREQLMAEEEVTPGVLIRRLRAVDPESADRHERNIRRIIRALEVYTATGKAISQLQGKGAPRYDALELELWRPREALHRRIDVRAVEQINNGLIEEVRGLIDAGADTSSGAFSSIGYRQALPYLNGEATLDETIQRIQSDCHRLVRHQQTWWRKNPRLTRIEMESAEALVDMYRFIEDFLTHR